MRRVQNFVDGELRDAVDGRTSELINPATGEVFAQAALSDAEDVDLAFQAAARAFPGWRDATPSERSLALLRIADAIEAAGRGDRHPRGREHRQAPPADHGRGAPAHGRPDPLLRGCRPGSRGPGRRRVHGGPHRFIRREPVGVCGQVTPWNYPMMMAVWKWAPALAAGNTVVLKPSDTTPVSTVRMAELMAEHLPPGVCNVLCGDRDTGRALVSHPTPQMVSITGQRARRDGGRPGGRRRPQAHPPRARRQGPGDRLRRCRPRGRGRGHRRRRATSTPARTAPPRRGCLAGPGIHDDFVAALEAQAKATRTGMPDDEDVLYGPLNNANQLDRVEGFVERAPQHAAGRDRRPAAGAAPATSTPRRSSRTSPRTTR